MAKDMPNHCTAVGDTDKVKECRNEMEAIVSFNTESEDSVTPLEGVQLTKHWHWSNIINVFC